MKKIIIPLALLALLATPAAASDICQQTFTFRLVKGSSLTHAEADDNFKNAEDVCTWLDSLTACSAGEVLTGYDVDGEPLCVENTVAHASTHASGGSDALSGTLAVGISGNAATATTATTATTANAGDSATAFFPAGTIEHERGGLEADVSAYGGLVRIAAGATSAVTDLAGLNAALGSSIADGAHTTDTNAATLCTGATTYLTGEGACVDIAAVYAPITHAHAGADITSGTVATARLGSGVADATTYLRGDQTWATVSAGASPAGSGSELQYRVDGSTFGAVTSSSVSGAAVTLGGDIAAPGFASPTSSTTKMTWPGGNQLGISLGGVTRLQLSGADMYLPSANGQNLRAGDGVTAGTFRIFGRARGTQGNPTAVEGGDGSGTNIPGGGLNLIGGRATGNAAGGVIALQTAVVGASGATVQTPTNRVVVNADGSVTFVPLATAPACDADGKTYIDTSGAHCTCWSAAWVMTYNLSGTGACT